MEIEDPDVPLAELPQTGLHMAHLLLAAIGAALSALGLALGIRARRPRKERID